MTRRLAKTVTAALAVVAAAALLAGCVSADGPGSAAPSSVAAVNLLAEHGLSGLDAREVITRLDTMPVAERPADLIASVRPDAVVLSDSSGATVSLPLPDDQFYVSIAPYTGRTHDCFFHSLTTCLGEMSNEDVRVEVTDRATGVVLVDETRRVGDNGFFGLWLPRAVDGAITIDHDAGSTTAPLSTHDDDPTCVTTLQLA